MCFFLGDGGLAFYALEERAFSIGWRDLLRISFLQETYSTSEVENIWKKQWKGDMFFSHGTGHSKGVLILVKEQLDFQLQID